MLARLSLRHLVFAWIALAVPGVATAQKVEGSLTMTIAAKVSVPTPTGERITSVRFTTADLLEVLAEDLLRLPPKSGRLVYRRDLADPFDDVVVFAVFNGIFYDVTDLVVGEPAEEIPGFSAHVEGYSLRPSDGALKQLAYEELMALVIGDIPTLGFRLTATATAKGGLRLLSVRGFDVGMVSTGLTVNLIGALAGVDFPEGAIVTGTLRYGPEKLVAP
jgi:hypothetical protein